MTCGFRNCQSRACGSTIRPDGHELAFCVAHEAIARHLPPLRSATCCTSEGCGRPQGSRSPLCKSCRPRYSAWGLAGYPVPQEAPMTEPTPEAQEAQTSPPAAPQDAAGEGAIPSAACTAIDGRILDRATAPGTDGESDGEPSAADVDDAYSGRWGQYTVGVDPATGKEHTAAYVVELVRPSDHQTTDGLLSAILGGKPTAPGPTLAEVQAQLERERERADAAQTQLREAVAELAAIAALIDPEDSPAFDANDQPIPLPTRVQVALMPDKPGQSRIEREIAAVLDRYDAPTTLGSVHVGVKGRVLVTARLLRDSTAVSNQMATEITEASALLTTLGANVTSSPRDALLQVLAALLPDVYRRLLESEAADTRAALARLQARVVNPPPPEKLAEYAAKVAEIDAKIAALDAGEVQK